jgi:hypothetical protein
MEALHGFPLEEAPVVVPDAELLESSPPHPAAISASAATTPPSTRVLAVIRLRDAHPCVRKIIKPPPVVKRAAPNLRSSRPGCIEPERRSESLSLDPVCTSSKP